MKKFKIGDLIWKKDGNRLSWRNNLFLVTANQERSHRTLISKQIRNDYLHKKYGHIPNHRGVPWNILPKFLCVRIIYFLIKNEINNLADDVSNHAQMTRMFDTTYDDLSESVKNHIEIIEKQIKEDFVPLGYYQDDISHIPNEEDIPPNEEDIPKSIYDIDDE